MHAQLTTSHNGLCRNLFTRLLSTMEAFVFRARRPNRTYRIQFSRKHLWTRSCRRTICWNYISEIKFISRLFSRRLFCQPAISPLPASPVRCEHFTPFSVVRVAFYIIWTIFWTKNWAIMKRNSLNNFLILATLASCLFWPFRLPLHSTHSSLSVAADKKTSAAEMELGYEGELRW